MKLFFKALILLILPVLLFVRVWNSYLIYEYQESIELLENEQITFIERNKRHITGISVLRSPGRIIDEAKKLGMVIPSEEQIILIENDESR